MPKVYVCVSCPYCKARYRDSSDAKHADGCPQPFEMRLMELQRQQVINTCPHCKSDTHVNAMDVSECVNCHSQWIPSWTQGTDAINASTVWFRMQGEPHPMTELSEKGEGKFPLREIITNLSRQIMEAKSRFAVKPDES